MREEEEDTDQRPLFLKQKRVDALSAQRRCTEEQEEEEETNAKVPM